MTNRWCLAVDHLVDGIYTAQYDEVEYNAIIFYFWVLTGGHITVQYLLPCIRGDMCRFLRSIYKCAKSGQLALASKAS